MIDERELIKTLLQWKENGNKFAGLKAGALQNDDDVLVWYECFSYGFNNIHQRYGIGWYCNNRWGGDVNGN